MKNKAVRPVNNFDRVNPAIAKPIIKRNKDLSVLFGLLDAAGEIDESTGAVTIDPSAVSEALARYAPPDQLEAISKSLEAIASDGFAMIDGDGLPWRSIEAMLRTDAEIPEQIRSLLGNEIGVASPDEVRAAFARRFATLPSFELDDYLLRPRGSQPRRPNTTKRLSRSAVATSGVIEELNPAIFVSGAQPRTSFSQPESIACLRAGRFQTHWWGWSFCFDQRCTVILADFFTNAGTVAGISALVAALSGGGAALAVVLFILGAVVWMLGTLLFWFKNNRKGACLKGNWPTPWFGPMVWATPA